MSYQNCNATGCETDLPEVQISDDCPGDIVASEIEEIYIAKADAAAFSDWTQPSEWSSRLSQSLQASGNEIRKLIGIGDKPAATPVIVNSAKRQKKKIDAAHQLNFTIDDVNQKNWDAATKLQCGSYKRIWYKVRGNRLFGGNSGVLVFLDVNPVFGSGDEVIKLVLSATWNTKQDPEMCVSPI